MYYVKKSGSQILPKIFRNLTTVRETSLGPSISNPSFSSFPSATSYSALSEAGTRLVDRSEVEIISVRTIDAYQSHTRLARDEQKHRYGGRSTTPSDRALIVT